MFSFLNKVRTSVGSAVVRAAFYVADAGSRLFGRSDKPPDEPPNRAPDLAHVPTVDPAKQLLDRIQVYRVVAPTYLVLRDFEEFLLDEVNAPSEVQIELMNNATRILLESTQAEIPETTLIEIFGNESVLTQPQRSLLIHLKNKQGDSYYDLAPKYSAIREELRPINNHGNVVKKLLLAQCKITNMPRKWFPKYGETRNWKTKLEKTEYKKTYRQRVQTANSLLMLDASLRDANVTLKQDNDPLETAYACRADSEEVYPLYLQEVENCRQMLSLAWGTSEHLLRNTNYLIASVLFLDSSKPNINAKITQIFAQFEKQFTSDLADLTPLRKHAAISTTTGALLGCLLAVTAIGFDLAPSCATTYVLAAAIGAVIAMAIYAATYKNEQEKTIAAIKKSLAKHGSLELAQQSPLQASFNCVQEVLKTQSQNRELLKLQRDLFNLNRHLVGRNDIDVLAENINNAIRFALAGKNELSKEDKAAKIMDLREKITDAVAKLPNTKSKIMLCAALSFVLTTVCLFAFEVLKDADVPAGNFVAGGLCIIGSIVALAVTVKYSNESYFDPVIDDVSSLSKLSPH